MMNDYLLSKIFLFGPPGEGRSSLIEKYCSGFNSPTKLTIGVDFHTKVVEFNEKKIRLQIWDMVEEERFRSLLSQYCKGANAAILIFDTSIKIEKVYEYIHFIREIAGDLPLMLIGNKVDGKDSQELTREKGEEIAKEFNLIDYFEISTRTGDNVDKMFMNLAGFVIDILDKY